MVFTRSDMFTFLSVWLGKPHPDTHHEIVRQFSLLDFMHQLHVSVTGTVSGAGKALLRMWSHTKMCKRPAMQRCGWMGWECDLRKHLHFHLMYFFFAALVKKVCVEKLICDLLMLSEPECENGDMCLGFFVFVQYSSHTAAHQIFTQRRSAHICLIAESVNSAPTSQTGFKGRTCAARPH